MVTLSFDAMTIPALLTPVAPTPIVKHKETELFADVDKVGNNLNSVALLKFRVHGVLITTYHLISLTQRVPNHGCSI